MLPLIVRYVILVNTFFTLWSMYFVTTNEKVAHCVHTTLVYTFRADISFDIADKVPIACVPNSKQMHFLSNLIKCVLVFVEIVLYLAPIMHCIPT